MKEPEIYLRLTRITGRATTRWPWRGGRWTRQAGQPFGLPGNGHDGRER